MIRLILNLFLGYYAYLEVSGRQRNRKAVLSTPAYGGSYANCTMNFYYHMYGKDTGVLRIHLINVAELGDSPGDTVLFELHGSLILTIFYHTLTLRY